MSKQVAAADLVVSARAPGKLILSGEHAVVYGAPALALTINRFATTTIKQNLSGQFQFIFLNDHLIGNATLHQLKEQRVKIEERYRKFQEGKLEIREVIHTPLELIQYALIYILENLFLSVTSGLTITVELTLPLGCGVGASAAVIISLTHALITYYGQTISVEKYLAWGRAIENLQHGRSSGLDLFLSLHGGCYFFAEGAASKRSLPKIPFTLVNSGQAQSSTGEVVAKVAERLATDRELFNNFAKVTLELDQALKQNDLIETKYWLEQNHQLLNDLGVVPERVGDFIRAVTKCGNVAKVTGAGAIAGDRAGVVLVVGENEIASIAKEYGYEILPVSGESDGVSIL